MVFDMAKKKKRERERERKLRADKLKPEFCD